MKSENNKSVPLVVIKRLPRYYRYLGELLKQGVTRISSKHLSEKMGVTASQIRQDLNCFGGFGQQGYGYKIENLYREIGEILGLTRGYRTIIIGAGNLGHALANHTNFEKRGFRLGFSTITASWSAARSMGSRFLILMSWITFSSPLERK